MLDKKKKNDNKQWKIFFHYIWGLELCRTILLNVDI
jgi:hypothetical protein